MAEAIVERALVAVGEHGIGLGRFLELLLGVVVARVAIGVVLQRQLAIRALDLLVRRLALDAEDLVVVALAHAFRHLHHRRPQQPVAEHVAAAELLDDFALAPALGGLVRDRLVKCGIEVGADASIGGTPRLRSSLEQLTVNQLDAAAIGLGALGAGVGLERALQIVDERQQSVSRSAAAASVTAWRSRSMRLR